MLMTWVFGKRLNDEIKMPEDLGSNPQNFLSVDLFVALLGQHSILVFSLGNIVVCAYSVTFSENILPVIPYSL